MISRMTREARAWEHYFYTGRRASWKRQGFCMAWSGWVAWREIEVDQESELGWAV